MNQKGNVALYIRNQGKNRGYPTELEPALKHFEKLKNIYL